jgi:mannosyltransferase
MRRWWTDIPTKTKFLLLIIAAASATLRLRLLEDRSIWFDEAFSWTLATRFPFAEMIERIARDVHPPGYYVLLRGWIAVFGDSLFAMRGLSVLFGTGIVVLVFCLCRDLFYGIADTARHPAREGEAIGLVAAALLGLSAAHIRWSQEIRMYAPGTFLAVLTTWLLWRGLTASRSVRYWIAVGVLEAVFAAMHNYCLFSIAAQVVFLAWLFLTRRTLTGGGCALSIEPRKWLVAASVLTALYGLWVPTLLGQFREVRQEYWIAPASVRTIAEALSDVILARNANTRPAVLTLVATSGFVGGILCRCLAAWSPANLLVAAMGAIPLLIAINFSFLVTAIVVDRCLLFILPFLCMAGACAVWRAPRATIRWALTASLLVGAGIAYRTWWAEMAIAERGGLREAVHHVLDRIQEADLIVVSDPHLYSATNYYLRNDTFRCMFVPTISSIRNYQGAPLLFDVPTFSPDDMWRLAKRNVWIIDSGRFVPIEPNSRAYSELNRSSFAEVHKGHRPVTVTLFAPRITPPSATRIDRD